jgi:hypothetical protein
VTINADLNPLTVLMKKVTTMKTWDMEKKTQGEEWR